jgi:hypothetical protein
MQRPSTITQRLPKPNTSSSTGLCSMTWRIWLMDSTRGSTARRMPKCSW